MSDSKAKFTELNVQLKALRALWSDITSRCRQTVMELSATNKDLLANSGEYLPDLFWKVNEDGVAAPETFGVDTSFGQLSLHWNDPVSYISSCITVDTGFGVVKFAELYTYRYVNNDLRLFRINGKTIEIASNDDFLASACQIFYPWKFTPSQLAESLQT